MKAIRTIGLAAIAAAASIALVGASPASAESFTVLCKEHIPEGCSAPHQITGHVEALSEHILFLTSKGTIVCTHSIILGEALGLARPLEIHLTPEKFSNCTLFKVPCTVENVKKGLGTLLKTGGNSGVFEIHGAKWLIECPGFTPPCEYEGLPELEAKGHNQETGELATLTAKESLLKSTGGIGCSTSAKWDAVYKFVLPHPVYISS
jgi:hypothetical protein